MVHLREAFVYGLALITIPDRRFDRPCDGQSLAWALLAKGEVYRPPQ